jgi:hypothetical protein
LRLSAALAAFLEKTVMMRIHVNAQTEEPNPFRLQAHALFESAFAAEQDLASGAYHPMPWQTAREGVQGPGYLAGRSRKTGGIGNITVRDYPSPRNAPHLCQHRAKHAGRLRS